MDSVLIVSEHQNPSKIERHYGPLADVAERTTMVCLTPSESTDSIRYRTVPTFGHRLIGICLMFFVAFLEGVRNDYDAVVSISLFPYGCFALALRPFTGAPAHLGIIGADIDIHATAWYGAVPRAAIKRFDSVSVPGSAHRKALLEFGVDEARVSVLSNAIDTDRYVPPTDPAEPTYDFLWIGRFSEEKDPLLFVEALGELSAKGVEFRAAMVGSGAERDAVERAIASHGLDDAIDRPGWVDDPRRYYYESEIFVLTSARDALPLTLIEAMATGIPSVVPAVGSVPDIADHGETALVVPDRTPSAFADSLRRLSVDDRLRARLGANATAVRAEFSYANARDDWRRILGTLAGADGRTLR
ncbi:group 1 glycosyl transferase [Natrinema pellirubrum DSM 15624]|uniref:Glycosyltransferase n=1 Tax=Natrinema pellirubrum (strain DSM 15624 / CIP 106293 / JCM 10476 / NCIMB 786 / 157) TaxID=797303 RepID=L0JI46_NATP1|nr:glycosyltransferase [Natrinema pellirubrum]AGB31200.1 glycosyltransferase [Natrinema pellirubrum DSM 15624]ELY81436.1 group 1 glycosyl transferase [Natrinema pellirubrum DSM 15624]